MAVVDSGSANADKKKKKKKNLDKKKSEESVGSGQAEAIPVKTTPQSAEMDAKRKRTEAQTPDDAKEPKKKKPKKGILKVRDNTTDATTTPKDGDVDGSVEGSVEEPPLVNPCFQPQSSSSSNAKKDKMRKKKDAKRAAKATAQEAKKNEAGEEIRRVEAREYLRSWKHDKDTWKFNKNRQTWLLKNLFATDALNDDSFAIALDYLRPLKGKAREETAKQAEAKVNETGVEFLQAERARLVAQMLS